jgi:hypothetical protein
MDGKPHYEQLASSPAYKQQMVLAPNVAGEALLISGIF